MSSNVINQVPFLRTTRNFPQEVSQLTVEVDRSYVDIANAVNSRIIGVFAVNNPSITGESWFVTANQRQQTLRKVFTFTDTTSITHNITVTDPDQFTQCWGSYTDGTNSYGLIWGNNGGTISNNISFYITSTQIVFEVDGSAAALTSGRIVLTWLSTL